VRWQLLFKAAIRNDFRQQLRKQQQWQRLARAAAVFQLLREQGTSSSIFGKYNRFAVWVIENKQKF
jgi:hypothetical protein